MLTRIRSVGIIGLVSDELSVDIDIKFIIDEKIHRHVSRIWIGCARGVESVMVKTFKERLLND